MNEVREISLLGGACFFQFDNSFSPLFLVPPDLEAQITLSAMSNNLSLRAKWHYYKKMR